jgi:aldose 1-epimerase
MQRKAGIPATLTALAALLSAFSLRAAPMSDAITHAPYGKTPAGAAVELYTLRNRQGMEAKIMTYGGIITSLTAPDRKGHYADVVLGYDSLAGYLKGTSYFGALIGRYGNRIAHGQFMLDGVAYKLATNDGPNTLHGGVVGFDKVVWKVTDASVKAKGPAHGSAGPQLALTYTSRDGE